MRLRSSARTLVSTRILFSPSGFYSCRYSSTFSLPVISISPFISNNSPANKQRAAEQVYSACTDTGFFLISDYQAILPSAQIESTFSLAQAFFALPIELKRTLKGSHNRGYFAYGEENLTTVYSQANQDLTSKELGDFKEGYDFGREIDPHSSEFGLPFRVANRWPDEKSVGKDWKPSILNYFGKVDQLGHVIMRIFATALRMDEHWFEKYLDKPMTTLRLLHYPPSGDRFGCGAHSDYGCCAILAQNAVGGLQLFNRNKEWVDIPGVKDTLVVNLGDMLQRWTNDRFVSTLHRVINRSASSHRFSIPFFFEPNFDTLVDCIPTCIDATHPKKYPSPIRYGDHLTNMYQATFT